MHVLSLIVSIMKKQYKKQSLESIKNVLLDELNFVLRQTVMLNNYKHC